MNKIRKSIALALAVLALMLGTAGSAGARPAGPAVAKSVKSVCETGSRGQKLYDRLCLRTGTAADGINLWYRDYDGRMISPADRRAFCRDATSTGNTYRGIYDGLYDVAYDSFRNHRSVLRVTALVGVMDCRTLGVRVK